MSKAHAAIVECLRIIIQSHIELKLKKNRGIQEQAEFLFLGFIKANLEALRDFICRKLWNNYPDKALENVREFLKEE